MVYYSGDLRFYLSALEEERCKIHVFRRELPLCYEVISHTIEAWKQKLKDEVISPGHPMLEEFMPPRDDDIDDVVGEDDDDDCKEEEEMKSGWLRSARLWNPIPDLNAQQDNGEDCGVSALAEKPPAIEAKSMSSSLERQQQRGSDDRKASGRVTAGKGEEKEGSGAQRKRRRCWSPELHRQFLNALEELGGSHFATPKHIKERMKVDGLTNDEIKSHLQKFRLHTRRSPSVNHDDIPAQAPPHLVIVGGIWMPPPDYSRVTGSMSLPPPD